MEPSSLFTPRASLVALGLRIRAQGLWNVIRQQLQIKQKSRKPVTIFLSLCKKRRLLQPGQQPKNAINALTSVLL